MVLHYCLKCSVDQETTSITVNIKYLHNVILQKRVVYGLHNFLMGIFLAFGQNIDAKNWCCVLLYTLGNSVLSLP